VIDAIKRLRNRDGSPTKSVGQVRLGPGNPRAAKEDDLALVAGSQTFRLLHACSGCFRLERSPGGPCTHWNRAALSRRTWEADLRYYRLGSPRREPAFAAR
jgi:hypothetical protein